jgi:hypothetical protein
VSFGVRIRPHKSTLASTEGVEHSLGRPELPARS